MSKRAILLALELFSASATVNASTWYVTTTGGTCSPDGTPWASPCSLQYALSNCGTGDEIWVKAGTYTPGTNRSNTFLLPDGCDLKGGFTGSGTTRAYPTCTDGDSADRMDFSDKPCKEDADCGSSGTCNNYANATILSGAIGTGVATDNSYHVVTYALSTDPDSYDELIEGFIIEGGYADGTGVNQNQGSAIHIRKSAFCVGGSNNGNPCVTAGDCSGGSCVSDFCSIGGPTVRDCLIQDNFAEDHGAINDHASDSSYQNCQFRNNQAAHGAALQIDNGSPMVSNCLFVSNFTNGPDHEGGAIWVGCRSGTSGCGSACNATILECQFVDNIVGYYGSYFSSEPGFGGAIFIENSSPLIDMCNFNSNDVLYATLGFEHGNGGGGAIWVEGASYPMLPTIRDCRFTNNSVSGVDYAAGGGIYSLNTDLLVESSFFEGNVAVEAGGGATHFLNGNIVYSNCVFVGNETTASAEAGGGAGFAVYNPDDTCIEFLNTNFVSNHCGIGAGAGPAGLMVNSDGGTIDAVNCIFWGNYAGTSSPSLASQYSSSYVDAANSIIQGFSGSSNGNSGTDPAFMRNPRDCDDDDIWGDPPCASGCMSGCDDYGYFYTRPSSPALDAGVNSELSATVCTVSMDVDFDIVGRTRIVDGPDSGTTATVDMGAYEWSGECHAYDDCDCLFPESGYMCCNNECGQCCTDGNCSAPVPYCRTTGFNTCVQCLTDAHCGAGNRCCDNICRTGWGCCDNSDCKLGKICCETTHTCVSPAQCGY